MTQTERAELYRLAERLLALAQGRVSGHDTGDRDPLQAAAQREIRRRQGRSNVVPQHLVGDAAWDVLLDLYIENRAGEWVSMERFGFEDELTRRAKSNHFETLASEALVDRNQDPAENGQVYVRLSVTGRAMVERVMREHIAAEAEPGGISAAGFPHIVTMSDEIAHQLGVSLETVEMHRLNMFGQLD